MYNLEIIENALENLRKQTQIQGRLEEFEGKQTSGRLSLELDDKHLSFDVVVKKDLRSHHIDSIMTSNKDEFPLMIAANRIFPKIKEELRQNNIAYLEENGNIFLKQHGTTVWIDNNKPILIVKKTGSRAFTKTGLGVVFEIIRDETWLDKSYRQIAVETGTSIGNISNIIAGLKQEGFLINVTKQKYKLENKKELIDKWINAYELRLKPALKIGTFRFLKADDFNHWKDLPLQSGKTYWGGEPGADLITKFLRPAELTIYTLETRNELIKNYRLIPDKNGNIHIFKKFWKQGELHLNQVVPALLVYADLININDRRSAETAQKIYDAYLQD